MNTVDARGQLCPAPLIMAKRALNEAATGDSFILIIDNQVAFTNVSRYLKDNDITFSVVENNNNIWSFTITKNREATAKYIVEPHYSNDIPHLRKGDFVVSISSDKIGDGDSELGILLMTNFIKAIRDLDILPAKMTFYNRGVFLGTKNSPVYETLKDLEQMGVNLYLCGTCINHYSLSDEIDTGIVSNMFEIAQILASAGKVIKP
jgi:selenium metabolism protein YedF